MTTRLPAILAILALVVPASVFAQCPELEPLDDGSGAFGAIGLPALVISEVKPGDYIELFNTTGAAIVLPGVYQLCASFVYAQVAGTVPAGGYATVPWPASFNAQTTATSGEMMLYDSALFHVSTDILDYIIWGNPLSTRKSQAVAVGKWVGANAPSMTAGSIHRKIGVKGTGAADYDNTSAPSPLNCTPPPTGVGDAPALEGARIWNSPNPFTASTNLEFVLEAPTTVAIAIYAVDGTLVRTFDARSFPRGSHRVPWDGTDQSGRKVASGTYLARLSGGVSGSARVTLVR